MYAAHFGLREPPFALTPDPGYLYLSPAHQEALAHLLYGVGEDGGFVQLTGEVGTGKTTLIRALLAQRPDTVDVALCLNPRLTVAEFVATLCDELGIAHGPRDEGLKTLIDALNRHLLAAHARGRHTVVIIDEAQNLSRDVLEQVRLLTNLETHRHKLLRMILVGQPELQTLLARSELRQLAQRITARYHLRALDRRQSAAYIDHRLRVAGGGTELFTAAARRAVYRHAAGIPRLINIICDRALLGAYARDHHRVNAAVARHAAHEVLYGSRRRWRPALLAAGGLAALLAAAGAARDWSTPLLWPDEPESAPLADHANPPVRPPATEPSASEPELAERLPGLEDGYGWRRLLALWNGDPVLAMTDDPCAAVVSTGLRCLHERTDWSGLARFNRPALLTLVDPHGDAHRVLLRALHDDQATLDLAGGLRTVAREQLEPLWAGEFLLFWRSPVVAELLRPGSRGEAVVWLRRQLAQAEARPPAEPLSDRFDAGLERRVRRFQQRQGLQADGLVGIRTLLLLNNLAPAPDTPLLTDRV